MFLRPIESRVPGRHSRQHPSRRLCQPACDETRRRRANGQAASARRSVMGTRTSERRAENGQNRTSPASPALARRAGTRPWRSIQARVVGDIHPATSRSRSWPSTRVRARGKPRDRRGFRPCSGNRRRPAPGSPDSLRASRTCLCHPTCARGSCFHPRSAHDGLVAPSVRFRRPSCLEAALRAVLAALPASRISGSSVLSGTAGPQRSRMSVSFPHARPDARRA